MGENLICSYGPCPWTCWRQNFFAQYFGYTLVSIHIITSMVQCCLHVIKWDTCALLSSDRKIRVEVEFIIVKLFLNKCITLYNIYKVHVYIEVQAQPQMESCVHFYSLLYYLSILKLGYIIISKIGLYANSGKQPRF